MKKYLKKISALLMAAIMVLTMCATVFAADEGTTTTEPGHATVKNVENGSNVKVKAYKIVNYNENGSYESIVSGKPADPSNPTPTEIQELSVNETILGGTHVEFQRPSGEGDFTYAFTEAGMWLVIVEDSTQYLYNPAVISVEQTPNGFKYGTLDQSGEMVENGVTYMKKSKPTITKTAVTPDVKGVQYGDIIQFEIKADIPNYKTTEENIKYTINDKLNGLTLVVDDDHEVLARVGAADTTGSENGDLTTAVNAAVQNGATEFTVNSGTPAPLDDAWILAHKGQQITITYYAKVTNAKYSVDLNTNTAKLEYSANNKTHSETYETKHYTFGIDTSINGKVDTGTPSKTGEFIKINSDGEVSYNETTGEVTKTEKTELLSGAQFQLHIGSADGSLFKGANGKDTFETVDGRLEINGLDSDVEYYLVETKAPTGYKLLATPIKVKVDAEFTGDVLTGYTVNIGDKGTHYTYNETAGTTTLVNDEDHPSNPFGFTNTKLGELPSTGGMGTYLFTIVGVVLMACAAGAFFMSRKKTQE